MGQEIKLEQMQLEAQMQYSELLHILDTERDTALRHTQISETINGYVVSVTHIDSKCSFSCDPRSPRMTPRQVMKIAKLELIRGIAGGRWQEGSCTNFFFYPSKKFKEAFDNK